jgi:hypothetical protein
MDTVTIPKILERLQELPAEKLPVVYDFVSYLVERDPMSARLMERSGTYDTMLASESILRQDWDRPEEEAAWADL